MYDRIYSIWQGIFHPPFARIFVSFLCALFHVYIWVMSCLTIEVRITFIHIKKECKNMSVDRSIVCLIWIWSRTWIDGVLIGKIVLCYIMGLVEIIRQLEIYCFTFSIVSYYHSVAMRHLILFVVVLEDSNNCGYLKKVL